MEIRKTTQKGKDYIIMEGIERNIKWPHFAGNPNRFGNASRGFNVEIPEDEKRFFDFFEEERVKVGEYLPKNADKYAEDGQEVKITYSVPVTVDMDHQDWYPCKIYLTANNGMHEMKKDELKELDDLDFTRVDIKCRKKVNARDKSLYVLYLSEAYFYAAVDDFTAEHQINNDSLSSAASDEEEVPFA